MNFLLALAVPTATPVPYQDLHPVLYWAPIIGSIVTIVGIPLQCVLAFFFSRIAKKREERFTEATRIAGEQFQERLKQFEDKLKREYDQYRAGLDYLSFENQTKFVQLHTKRAETIVHLHGLIENSRRLVEEPGAVPSKIGEITPYTISISELGSYCRANSLYFSATLAHQLDRWLIDLIKVQTEYNQSLDYDGDAEVISVSPRATEALMALDTATKALEKEFRQLLGTE